MHGRIADENYGALVDRLALDVLVEDDCESIGGPRQTCVAQLSPAARRRVRCVMLPEFLGLGGLPDHPAGLLAPPQPGR
ncbi:MAG: hypothetical protein JO132_10995 [Streptosporangiaceae bacterium]|nr:hypothetical protein [Streptosporangiaceae bacterium]